MAANFVAKYRNFLIFVALVLLVVMGERFFRSASDHEQETIEAKVNDPSDRMVTTVREEGSVKFTEEQLDASHLRELEKGVIAQASEGAKGLVALQLGVTEVTWQGSALSKVVTLSDKPLGVIEVTLTPTVVRQQSAGSISYLQQSSSSSPNQVSDLATLHFTKIFGFVDNHPVSVTCVRASGKPVSILSGECGLRLGETFQIDLD